MSGGTLCKVSVGRIRGASNNALYITRQSAVTDRAQGVLTRHLEEATDSRDFAQLRTDVSSYFWAREEVELAREGKSPTNGKSSKFKLNQGGVKTRQTRTHYRVILSFEREVETEKAKLMVSAWLDKTPFKNAPAIAAIHRDTSHPHAHLLIDSRQVTGKKVDLSPRQYRTLDEIWNEIYCREFGLDHHEHLNKKAETREYKRAVLKAKRAGEPPPERPSRSNFPERDKFTNRAEREEKSIATDETWNAGRRFDRSVRKIERRIKSQFDLRYQLKRQLNPLAQLESRIEAVRQLGELVSNAGKGIYDAYQRRVALRESNAQGERGVPAQARGGSGAVTRADTDTVRTVTDADPGTASQEGRGRSTGQAIAGETEAGISDGRGGAVGKAAPNGVERGTENVEGSGAARGAARVGSRVGQEGNEGEFHLSGRDDRKAELGTERSAQSAHGLTASAGGEEHYAAGRLSISSSHRAAGSEKERADYPGDECSGRKCASPVSEGESLGRTEADRARDGVEGRRNSTLAESSVEDVPGNFRAGNVGGRSPWSEEILDPAVDSSGFDPLRLEPQGLSFSGPLSEGVGREVQTETGLDIREGLNVRGDAVSTDLVGSGAAGIWEEPDGRGRSAPDVHSLGSDDALRAQWGVDEKYLPSSLFDDELKDRFLASNEALLAAVNQNQTAQTIETSGQVIEAEAESAEVADAGLEFFIF
jgi:hypothetical protein